MKLKNILNDLEADKLKLMTLNKALCGFFSWNSDASRDVSGCSVLTFLPLKYSGIHRATTDPTRKGSLHSLYTA